MIRGSPVKHDQNCLLKFPKAFRQKYFKLVLQNRFYYAKKKKQNKTKQKKLICNVNYSKSWFTLEFKTLMICMQILLNVATHFVKF